MRTILSLIGIIIGVCALITLVSVVDGLFEDTKVAVQGLKAVIVYKKDIPSPIFGKLKDTYFNQIKNINGVESVSYDTLTIIGKIDNKEIPFRGPSATLKFIGIEPKDIEKTNYSAAKNNIIKGTMIKANDNKKILMSKETAKDLKKSVGSRINIDGTEFIIKGIFDGDSDYINTSIIGLIQDTRSIYNIPNDEISSYQIIPTVNETSKNIAKKIEFRFDELQAIDSEELTERIGEFLNTLRLLVILVTIIAAIIASVGIVNTTLMSVMERTKEIGTLKATGWTKGNIIQMVLIESVMISLIGTLLGIILSYFLGYLITYYTGLSTLITITLLIQTFIFAITIGIISGLYPAYVASKLDPVEAIRGK